MALQERLQIIVTADAKGAAREFQRVGDAADKNLGKADDRVAKLGATLTSFGTQTVLAAGVAGVGLFKAADAASAYGEQVSRATKTFGDEAVPELEAFADAAADTAGISKTAALQASSTFAAFGKQIGLTGSDLAGFSTQLVQSAGDFASLNDISVDQSLTTFISALSGEQEAIKRFGIDMSAAAVEAEALAMGISDGSGELTAQEKVLARQSILLREGALWAGDFADTSDSLANRQRQLAAEFENAKVALGEGLLPLAEAGVGTLQGLASSFGGASDESASLAGKLAGMAVVAAGATGAISLVAGQVLKMHDRFTTTVGSGDDATRTLNNFGKAAAGAGAALTALAAIEIGGAIVNDLTNATERIDRAITDLRESLDGIGDDPFQALIDTGIQVQSEFRGIGEIFASIGREVQLGDFSADIEDWEEAIRRFVAAASEAEEQELLSSLLDERSNVEPGTEAYEDLTTVIGLLADQMNYAARDAALNERATGEAGDAADGAADGYEKLGKNVENAGDALRDSVDPFLDVIDAARGYDDALRDLSDAKADLADLRSQRLSSEDEAEGLRRIDDAARSVADAYRDVEDAQRSLEDARLDLADINEDIADQLNDLSGITVGTVEYDEGTDKLKDLLRDQRDAHRQIEDAERGVADAQRGVEDAKRSHAEAQRDLNQARLEALPTQRELEDAERAVEDANRDVIDASLDNAEAQAILNQKVADGEISMEDYHKTLLTMAKDAPPEVQKAIQLMGEQFDWLARKAGLTAAAIELRFVDLFGGSTESEPGVAQREGIPAYAAGGGSGANSGGGGGGFVGSLGGVDLPRIPGVARGGRATGGPVSEGGNYFINERGDELFAPSTNGFVMNAEKTNQLLDGLGKLISGGGQRGGNSYTVQVPERSSASAVDIVRQLRASEWMHEGAA